MKHAVLLALGFVVLFSVSFASPRFLADTNTETNPPLIAADNKNIQYRGRIDFTDPKKPKFWAPGVYVKAKFRGTFCDIVVNDEALYGTSHNYLEIVIDDKTPFRVQTTGAANIIHAAAGLPAGDHTITFCKDTEAGIGYLEFVGFQCAGLRSLPPPPARKLEFIGDSITCGTGSDLSEMPCGQGQWYAQHNAYLSYGPSTARLLHAQWQITAVSGIGLAHSCCGMKLTMPQVFDKVNLRDNAEPWDFRRYQPDAVLICLGQNDGAGDEAAFQETYLGFLGQVRAAYPKAQIVCLTSPMADASLTAWLKDALSRIVSRAQAAGDKNIHAYFWSRQFHGGCGGHPDLAEHQILATELSAALKPVLKWK